MAESSGARAVAMHRVRSPGRRRAVSIYGTIVTAAILSSAGDRLSVADLLIAIVVTLFVATWPMVSASFAPLLFLVVAWLLGASSANAANAGLAAAIVELVLYGWAAGRAAHLKGKQQLAAASAAAFLGLVLITLKDVVLVHLH